MLTEEDLKQIAGMIASASGKKLKPAARQNYGHCRYLKHGGSYSVHLLLATGEKSIAARIPTQEAAISLCEIVQKACELIIKETP